ncbi:hypothetical protein Tco_0417424 [Tanacetum coccineum]
MVNPTLSKVDSQARQHIPFESLNGPLRFCPSVDGWYQNSYLSKLVPQSILSDLQKFDANLGSAITKMIENRQNPDE